MARTNAVNIEDDIVDAKGRPLTMAVDNNDTVTSSNNLTKSALIEFPIKKKKGTIISARNLSRDNALETQKVDKTIPTDNSEKKI